MEVFEEEMVEPSSLINSKNVDQLVKSENALENCGNLNHRRLLCEAVKLENHIQFLNFAYGMRIPVQEMYLNPLNVLELGVSPQLPVSLQSIQHLKEISVEMLVGEHSSFSPTQKQVWEIGDSKICGSTLENHGLASIIKNNLELPLEMDVAPKFKKLVLYTGKQCFINNIGSWWADGKFGTLLLQLPVEGGHQGGRLNIEYQGRKTKFENHLNSDNIFYLSSFYDCCEHFIEPVVQGNKLMLVYDLIWKNAKIEIPQNFPLFLTAKKQIKNAIELWLHRLLLKSQNDSTPDRSRKENGSLGMSNRLIAPANQLVVNPDYISPAIVVDSSLAIALQGLSSKNESMKNGADVVYSEEDLRENILFVVLNEKYDEKLLTFQLLRKWDRVFTEALLQCDRIEVHLALAKERDKKIEEGNFLSDNQFESLTKSEEVKVLEVSRLIDPNDVTRNLSIRLDWDKQLIGSIQPNQEKTVKNENHEHIDKSCSTYPILLFWPKPYSVQIYCHFGIHSLLNQMSKSLASLSKGQEDDVRRVKSDLQQLISFCCAEPRKAWIKSGIEKGELTLRLLRFCIALRAREEGLDLLKTLGLNFEEERNDGIANNEGNFEGIQNEQVAHAIAIFGCQIASWSVIADPIERLITPNRIAKQLIPICKLSKSLLSCNCLEGAGVVADCVSSFFRKIDETQVSKVKLSDVKAFVDLVVALETNRDSSNWERTETFILFFSKLRPSLQCRLVLDFSAQKNRCLKIKHSWQFIFRDLCEILSVSCKVQPPPAKTIAFDFMKAIKGWLLEVAKEIELRPELKEHNEPNIDLEYAELKKGASSLHENGSETTEERIVVGQEPETLLTSRVDGNTCQASLELWDASNGLDSQGTSKDSYERGPSTDDWSATTDKIKTACRLTVSVNLECDSWNAESDTWASATQPQITSSKTTGGKESIAGDWDAQADSCKTDLIEKEVIPHSNLTQSNDEWGACADAWASSCKGTTSSNQRGTNGCSQSDWGTPAYVPATSSIPNASDDWDSFLSCSNPTTAKTPYAPKSGRSDEWGTSEDPWRPSTGRSTMRTSQSTTWGSVENTDNSWTSSGYTARSGGRGGGWGAPRPCPKCNEEGHTSYDCPTRGRGRGNGASRGQRPCYKCNQEGHMSYNCPTGLTRGGRGGGRGRGTRVCYKCNQEGHISYECPTGPSGRRGGGRGSARPVYESTYEAANSSHQQPPLDDWGAITSASDSKSLISNASERTSEKEDAWATSCSTTDPWATSRSTSDPWTSSRSTSDPWTSSRCTSDPWATASSTSDPWPTTNSSSDPWATNASTVTGGARNSSGYNAPSRRKVTEVEDWGIPISSADATPALLPATSTGSNGTAGIAGADDWGLEADAWSSITTYKPLTPSTRPNAVAKTDGDDWAAEADVWSGRDGSTANAKIQPPANEINEWGVSRTTAVNSGNPSDLRLVSSELNPFVWNGTISHRTLHFKICMKNSDKNSSVDLANLAMPSRLKVVGTIEPEKVWNYLKQVKATSLEKIVLFTFTPVADVEISYMDCYNYFVDGFRKTNWFGVVGSNRDSKLPCAIKDFYIIPLPKEEPIPKELETVASAKFLRENRVSDLLLAMVIIQNKRLIDQASIGAPTRPSKIARVEKTVIPVEEAETERVAVRDVDAAIQSESVLSQPPSRLAAIRQKLQQDIQSVDPVKARIHSSQQSVAKKPSPKLIIPGKLPAAQATDLLVAGGSGDVILLEEEKEACPSQVTTAEDKFHVPAVADGEFLMKQAIMEELNRQIEASKQGKLTDMDPTLQLETLISIEPVKSIASEVASSDTLILCDGPLTRSRTKRQPVAKEVPEVNRRKVTTSSRISHCSEANEDLRSRIEMLKSQRRTRLSYNETETHKEAMKRRCFVRRCRNYAQKNSVYCGDECIFRHVQDSLNTMRKEKMKEVQLQKLSSGSTSLSPPSTSSDESAWTGSIDCSLLMNQPTPALASKLLAMAQKRKSMATVENKSVDLAEELPISVLERTTGKILCGSSAPTVGNLEEWLKSNSTYEIIQPDFLPTKPCLPTVSSTAPVQLNTAASYSKPELDGCSSKNSNYCPPATKAKVSRKRSVESSKEEETCVKVVKPDNESTRAISKSSLKEALWNRCKDINDLKTDEVAVEDIANKVEESLYCLFKQDVGTKYKSKYRSLIYNIKDPKNLGLFREIVTKQITPVQLVKMSTEELASKDLAEWREREAKRQLDMIEKNEQERLSQVNKYLIKTHKGEEIIQKVSEDFDDLNEDTSKMDVVPDTSPEHSASKPILSKCDGDRNTSSSQTVEEKDDIHSTSSRSSRKRRDDVTKSKSSRKSFRHSGSHSRGSDFYRRDRRLEKRNSEKSDRHSTSRSKSRARGQHHSQRSDRNKNQEEEEEIPECVKPISQPTESEDSRSVNISNGEQLTNPTPRLNADDGVPISAADSDAILLQHKLVKQLAVLDELDRQSRSPERELIEGVRTLEVLPERGDSVTSEIVVSSVIPAQLSKSKEQGCNLLKDDGCHNGSKEKVMAEVNQIDTGLEEHRNVDFRALVCKSSFPNSNEGNLLDYPGKLIIAEDDDSFLDLDEQFLKQQAIVEELNSSLTTFLVANNIDIQSHDENLNSSFTEQTPTSPPGMRSSDLKDRDIFEIVEPSRSPPVEYYDRLGEIFSTDVVPYQSKQTTPVLTSELNDTDSEKEVAIAGKKENSQLLPA